MDEKIGDIMMMHTINRKGFILPKWGQSDGLLRDCVHRLSPFGCARKIQLL